MRAPYVFIFALQLFFCGNLHAGVQEELDSLLSTLNPATPLEERAQVYSRVAAYYRQHNNVLALRYADSTLALARQINDTTLQWEGMNSRGEAFRLMDDLDSAMIAHQQALSYAERNGLRLHQAHSCNNLGLVFKRMKRYDRALDYLEQSRTLYAALGNRKGEVTTCTNIGNVYYALDKNTEAAAEHNRALEIATEINDIYGLSDAYTNLGNAYYELGEKKRSKENYLRALKVREQIGNEGLIADACNNYGYMLMEEGDYDSTRYYFNRALDLARRKGYKETAKFSFLYLCDMALLQKDYRLAYYYSDTARMYRDSLFNENRLRSLNEATEKYESEKHLLRIDNLTKENALREADNKRQSQVIAAVTAGLVIALVLAVLAFLQFRAKKKANLVIAAQKNEVELQKNIIQEKNREIIDSINYAKRIQHAVLPSASRLERLFPQHFILYQPKDIVAGDFYWADETPGGTLLAVADCTGHGVPGALVSIVSHSALERALKEYRIAEPHRLLDKVNELVSSTFSGTDEEVKDGMDIALVRFNGSVLEFSGANNPCWIVRNGAVTELKPDKQPIGAFEHRADFTLKQFALEPGDMVYLFSDGYADQFGGPKGKKFKYRQLQELFVRIHTLPPAEQKRLISEAFENWRGNLEQVDDVLIFGVKV